MKDRINDNLKQVPDNSMQGKNGSCRIIIQKVSNIFDARLQGNGEADNFTGKKILCKPELS